MIEIINWNDHLELKQWLNTMFHHKNISNDEVLTVDFNIDLCLSDCLEQNSLFNNYKYVVINNADFLTKQTIFDKSLDLIKFLKDNQNNYDFYLLVNQTSFKKEILTKHHLEDWNVKVLKKIDEKQKQVIINDLLHEENLNISKDVYKHLINAVDCNYGNIKNEIKKIKLGSFAKLTNHDLISLISNYNEENIFNLLEKIIFKKYDEAFKIYQFLIDKQEDEIMIINALSAQLFNLYECLKLLQANINLNKIAEILQLPIYIINLYKNKFIYYNISKLESLINNLYQLEIDIKLQKINKKLGLRKLLLEI